MKKSKFMNLQGIVFLAILIAVFSSCKQPVPTGDTSGLKVISDSLPIPENLTEITDTAVARGYIREYQDSLSERNFGQVLPYEYANYLVNTFENKNVVLSLAKKDSIVFTMFVIQLGDSTTNDYKYFADARESLIPH